MGWFGRKRQGGADRRRFERVKRSDERDSLDMSIIAVGGEPVPVEWIDLSAGGVKFTFGSSDSAISWDSGARLVTRVVVGDCTLDVSSSFLRSFEEDGAEVNIAEFHGIKDLMSQVQGEVFKLLNRRKTFRVTPSQIVWVEVSFEGGRARGRLVDISGGGIGVEFHPAAGVPPSSASKLQSRFKLPGETSEIHLESNVEHQTQGEDRLVLGQSLIREDSSEAEALEERVIDYVMTRQREQRQEDAR